MSDLYALLGVDFYSTRDEILRAFRQMSLRCHPDKGGDPGVFLKITRAKEILIDEQLRATYDEGGMTAVEKVATDADKMEISANAVDADNECSDSEGNGDFQWMSLSPGEGVPPGSEVSMNMSTGERFVKRFLVSSNHNNHGEVLQHCRNAERTYRKKTKAYHLQVCSNYERTRIIQLRIHCGYSNIEFDFYEGQLDSGERRSGRQRFKGNQQVAQPSSRGTLSLLLMLF